LRWKSTPIKCPPARFSHSAVVYHNKMYVFGGRIDAGKSLFGIFILDKDGPMNYWNIILPIQHGMKSIKKEQLHQQDVLILCPCTMVNTCLSLEVLHIYYH